MVITLSLHRAAPVGVASHFKGETNKAAKTAKLADAKVSGVKTQKPKAKVKKQPKPAPPPRVVRSVGGCRHYQSLFAQYDWNVNVAMAICQAESGGNPNAVSNAAINWNGVPDYGLMQLNGIPILNPAKNVAYAYYHKYKTPQGWNHWTTYTSGRYRQFLN